MTRSTVDPVSRITRLALAGIIVITAASRPLQAGQLIWLDFDAGSSPAVSDHSYTAAERAAVEAGLAGIFAPFGHTVTSVDPAPGLATKVLFNDGGVGTSTAVDFRNLITTIDLAATDAGFALDLFGKPRTSSNVVQTSINLAAHELLHVLGARHPDAYQPIGAMAGGGLTGSTFMSLTTVLGIDGERVIAPDLFVSTRSATKLAFADAGTVVIEGGAINDSLPSAESLALMAFEVPNTLPAGDPMAGVGLVAHAVAVKGTLDGEALTDLVDYYVIDAKAGQTVTIELMSDVLGHRLDEFDAKLELLDPTGAPLAPVATGGIDGTDPTLLDVTFPFDGPFFIEVAADGPPGSFAKVGEYELLVYSVTPVPLPAAWVLMLCGLAAFAARAKVHG